MTRAACSDRSLTILFTLARAVALAATVAGCAVPPDAPPPDPAPDYPPAPPGDAVDAFHGERVPDPWRWLEDLGSERTRAFVEAQNALAAARLDSDPAFDAVRARLLELQDFQRFTGAARAAGRTFLVRSSAGGVEDRTILALDDGAAVPRALFDVGVLTEGDGHIVGSSPAPSPDGRRVAIGVFPKGSRRGALRVVDVETGEPLPETIPGYNSAVAGVAWVPDGSGFFYTRFPEPAAGADDQAFFRGTLRFHRIGADPEDDPVVLQAASGEPDRWFSATVPADGRWLVVVTARAEHAGNQIRARRLDAPTGRLVGPWLEPVDAVAATWRPLGGRGDRLWFRTDDGAPNGRVVALDLRAGGPARPVPVELVPETDAPLQAASAVGGRLLLTYTRHALPHVEVRSTEGRLERVLDLPAPGMIWSGFVGRPDDGVALFSLSALADPGSWYRLDPASGRTELLLRPELAFDPDDFVLEQRFYESADGTRVPIFLARARSTMPGPETPTFLYGYGALGWSAFPWFQAHIVLWMERGGQYALPGIRGGGEYGARWHEAGKGANKQTSIDDFLAAAGWLVDTGRTSPGRLVANGGSASGVLVGAALTQAPERFGAALIDIPALDLLRFEQLPNGPYWVPEYGSPSDLEAFRVLRAYSPYHNVEAGRCYPPTLLTAGEKDETIVPSHAYKFAARLQAAQRAAPGCRAPALLQVVRGAGHSFGTTPEQTATTLARQLVFLSRAVGPEADEVRAELRR